jgi:hypothetical protein
MTPPKGDEAADETAMTCHDPNTARKHASGGAEIDETGSTCHEPLLIEKEIFDVDAGDDAAAKEQNPSGSADVATNVISHYVQKKVAKYAAAA